LTRLEHTVDLLEHLLCCWRMACSLHVYAIQDQLSGLIAMSRHG
jgi:hypothetical protein